MGGVPVYREEPVTVSDLMTMGDTGEHHYELYGIDLNELTASLVAESREDRVRIPQHGGTWRWEKESDLALEPEPELLPEPVPEPEPVERDPLPRSASEAILGTPNPPGDTPIGLRVDPQYRRPAEPRSDTPRERAPRWGPGPRGDW
jgi:hypothetical protein